MSRAVLLLIDGLRPDAIAVAECPNLQAFLAESAHTLTAQSVMPSVTLPCHMSIFHSVPPERHGITTNIYTPMARPLPGLIERVHSEGKQAAYFHNWEPLRNLNQPETLHFAFYVNESYDIENGDISTVALAADYMSRAVFDFTFLYIGTVDTAGHAFGWMSDDYLKQIARIDGLVGEFLASVPEDVTVLIQSDHGGHDRSHGTESPEDMTIPWMIRGPGIKRGYAIQRKVSLLDTAPTLAHIMGVPADRAWEGQPVDEIFV